ncbi:MAG: hypothetical protein EXR77_00960 [Myxococcales bacterium]|nr:hypothetical protein [Myxococcales bacterium]
MAKNGDSAAIVAYRCAGPTALSGVVTTNPALPPSSGPTRDVLDSGAAAALALVAAALAHRLVLTGAIGAELADGANWWQAAQIAAAPAWRDVFVAAVGGGVAMAVAALVQRRAQVARRLATGTGAVALLVCGLFGVAHLELALGSHFGLSWTFLKEGFASGDGNDAIAHARADEVLRGSVAPAIFGLALLAQRWPATRLHLRRLAVVALVVGVFGSLAAQWRRPLALPDAVPACANIAPLWYLGSTIVDSLSATKSATAAPRSTVVQVHSPRARSAATADGGPPVEAAEEEEPVSVAATASQTTDGMRLRGADFVNPTANLHKSLPTANGTRYNIVWIIMESAGLRYAMGKTAPADKPPMPFLSKLAAQGWLLKRHHSTSNSSAISIVSMLSGLYPSPSHYAFATRRELALPSLATLIGADYSAFFVTPGKLNYYFPHGFLKNSGFADVQGYDEVPVKKTAVVQGIGKDEPATVEHFLRRIDAAKPPFIGVYYSFIAHWDYADYGPMWKRYNSSRTMDRYLNNLWLLDNLIERIVAHLKASGRGSDTLVVLCGDHGEAFGQHEGNWSHPFAIYEENLETPAVLWQPNLLTPRVDERLTAHIDLVPTVLDAVGAPWPRQLLQGESLFQAEFERKYLFGFGKDGAVFAIDPLGPKIALPREGACAAYDLVHDPSERRRLDCNRYAPMLAALKKWKTWQRTAIAAHSKATVTNPAGGSSAGGKAAATQPNR